MPSTRLVLVTLPASKQSQLNSAETVLYALANPADRCSAPANFGAMVPLGREIGGGHTTRTGGTVMPGSIGALLISLTSARIPSAADHALLNGCGNWKSFVPSIRITSARGE